MHHIHVWHLDENRVALEAHVVLEDENFALLGRIKRETKSLLKERFGIGHSTLEFESPAEDCGDRSH